jgi:hypothetical protein
MKFYFLIILTFLLGCENTSELVQLGDGTFESKYKLNDSINLTKYYDIDKKLIGKIYFNIQSKNRLAFVYENKKLILTEYKNQKKRDFVIYKKYNSQCNLENIYFRTYANDNLIVKDFYKNGRIKEINYFYEGSDTINSSVRFNTDGTENDLSNYIKMKFKNDTLYISPTLFQNKNFLELKLMAYEDKSLKNRLFISAQIDSKSMFIPFKTLRIKIPKKLFLIVKIIWSENAKNKKWNETHYIEVKDFKNLPPNNLNYIRR